MDSPQPATSRPSVWKLGLLLAALGLALLCALGRSGVLHSADQPPAALPSRPQLYVQTEPARNPERLTLLVDPLKVVGWISGAKDYSGTTVAWSGADVKEKVKVEPGNTFTWKYQVARNTRTTFKVGNLQQIVTLVPPAKWSPSVFFVLDRNVYRPKQTLHFAAFLRQMDQHGEFQPLTKKAVTVQLKTERKSTVVKTWKLTADGQGRLTGSYTFTDADPLDNYHLTIANYLGNAQVSLAEYRKSKVQLVISGERAGTKMKLRFQAIDFMDKPVPGNKVTFTAQVIRNPFRPPSGSLKGEEFVHAGAGDVSLRMEDLTEDEQLVVQVDPTFDPGMAYVDAQGAPVAQISGEVALAGKSSGEYLLNIPQSCQQPGYSVVVNAILTDASGREERRTRTLPLAFLSENLKLSLPRTHFDVDEGIPVKASTTDGKEFKGIGTLVAMRLSAPPNQPLWQWQLQFNNFGFQGIGFIGVMGIGGMPAFGGMPGFGGIPPGFGGGIGGFGAMPGFGGAIGMGGGIGGFGGMPGFGGGIGGFGGMPRFGTIGMGGFNSGFGFNGFGQPIGRWLKLDPPEPVKRTLVTAVVFKGDTATMKLAEPGAYKLIAILEQLDGRRLQQEIGCLVQPRQERQPLTLLLDKHNYAVGDTLTGCVQSRFADARVLLTLRDSVGIRLWKTLQLKDGKAEIKETLPDDLRYGCVVTVQYANEPRSQTTHLSSRSIHVEPVSRTLKIEAKTRPVYGPGEKVVLDVQVNRQEPVDLIVSVYDRALLNINPREAVDIRSFYLADERAFSNQAREHLQRLLAGVTVNELLRKAAKEVEELKIAPNDPRGALLATLLTNSATKQFTTQDIVLLMNLAGVKARVNQYFFGPGSMIAQQRGHKQLLLDLLNAEQNGWRLQFSVFNDVFVVSDYNPAQLNPGNMMPFFPYGQPIGVLGGAGIQGGLGFQGSPSVLPMGALGGLGGLNGSPSFGPVLPVARQPGLIGAAPAQQGLFIRRDFSDSAYWNAKVRTDANGKAQVHFQVPHSLTGWQVVVTGITKNMHVGQDTASFQVSKPIMVGPILPRVFTEGDVVKVSANVVNRGSARQKLRVRLKVDNGEVLDQPEQELTLEAGTNEFVYWNFKAGSAGFTQLLMSAECPAGSDASLKRLPVTRASVEEAITKSGFCKEPVVLELPKDVNPKTAQLEIRFAPTLAADLVDTLDYLVEYPYGCVEQTMSRFLPAIKVAQILNQFQLDNPGLTKKLPGCVQGGIKRLLELQQPDGGWGWNGNAQTHEMMTPYALYGLLQAEKAGYAIPAENAVQNGLNRLQQFINNMNEQQATDRIYCMYVYGHRNNLDDKWWEFIDQQQDKDKLSDYALALALELAMQKGKADLADKLAERLHKRAQVVQEQVHWNTARFSRWADDPLEITAVVLKALVAHDPKDKLIPGVLAYFNVHKRGNRWNSTKDTALIVFALCDYLAKQNIDPRAGTRAAFRFNGGPLTEVKFTGQALTSAVRVPAEMLVEGKNTLSFENSTPGVMYRLILRHYRTAQDLPAKASGIKISREYWLLDGKGKRVRQLQRGDSIERGSYLECLVKVAQEDGSAMSYLVVENTRPSCCEVIAEDDHRFPQQRAGATYVLREDRETHVAYHHEQTPAEIQDCCVLYAELAGEYVVAPARAELMYQTEVRGHSGTFRFKVVDKPGK